MTDPCEEPGGDESVVGLRFEPDRVVVSQVAPPQANQDRTVEDMRVELGTAAGPPAGV